MRGDVDNAPAVGGQISTAADNVPQWAAWSSTVDLLLCLESPTPDGCVCPGNDCAASGSHFYPDVCQDVPNSESYRVLGQVGKVDDSFHNHGVWAFVGILRFSDDTEGEVDLRDELVAEVCPADNKQKGHPRGVPLFHF